MTPKTPEHRIGSLFHPNNVVLVGASDRPGHWSQRVYDNLKRFGFSGNVYPVNPNRKEIWGTPCYPEIGVLPEPPDHLAIFTPAHTTLQLLEAGGKAGARSATVYAASFGEGGDPGDRRLGAQLREAIARSGIAVVGPNCMGVACGEANFSTVPDESLQQPMPGPVAVIVQSGAMCTVINRAINDLGLKSAYIASCGSQFDCTIADFIDYLADRPEIRVALCYIEAVPDAERFLAAARRARENGKAVVAVKVGASEASRATALAHTGSLAGSAEAFEAVAGSAGVIRCKSFEEAIEAVEFLARQPLPAGRRIAVMSNSGALRSLVTEAAERTGATLATFSDATEAVLRSVLEQQNVANPLDTIRTIPAQQYAACVDALVGASEVDILLTAEDLPVDRSVERRVGNLRALEAIARRAQARGKSLAVFTPLLVSPSDYGRSVRAEIPHVPILRGTEQALRTVTALARAAAQPIHSGPFMPLPADNERTRSWRGRAAALTEPTALNEVDSKALLTAYGITMPSERLVRSAEDAVAAAEQIGFPVVLKGVSAKLPHKSDLGLVHLHLADANAVRQAAATLAARAASIPSPLDGMLVAQHVRGGTEVVLGVQRDVEMGPVVMFGLGGVMVELFQDISFAPATLDRERARAMVQATRAAALLQGFRGRPKGDLDALCDTLIRLGQLARELADVIESVDVNPLLVREQGVVALDGLVVLRPLNKNQGDCNA